MSRAVPEDVPLPDPDRPNYDLMTSEQRTSLAAWAFEKLMGTIVTESQWCQGIRPKPEAEDAYNGIIDRAAQPRQAGPKG